MKINSKKFIKRRILPAIASVVVFCLVVLLIVATRKTEASADNDKVSIGTKEYTVDNPMTILEIVPDDTYDIYGPMIGRYDTANSDPDVITWDRLIENAPKGAENEAKLVDYLKTCVLNYVRSMQTNLSGTGYEPVIIFNGEDMGPKLDEKIWVGHEIFKKINYTITKDNIKIAFRKQKAKWDDPNEYLDSNIQDIFSYFVLGSKTEEGQLSQGELAQGKVQVRVKKAQNVTIEDINDAGLVLLLSSNQSYMNDVYNNIKKYTSINVTGANQNNYQWSYNSGVDLKPDVAIELLYENAHDGKAVIYAAMDKDTTSNIGIITRIMNGIENEYLIRDFIRKPVKDGYSGNKGSITVSGNKIKVMLNKNGKDVELDILGNDSAFVKDYYGREQGESFYPAYNTKVNLSNNKVRKNSFVYTEGKTLYQGFSTGIASGSDYDSQGHYLGAYYEDAKDKLGKKDGEDIKVFEVIRYILGAQDTSYISDIKVLEVEPFGYYRYLTDTEDRRKETEKTIKKWFGIASGNDAVSITVDHVSMNGFNGMNVDLAAEYDLIIVGSYGKDLVNTSTDKDSSSNKLELSNVYSKSTDVSEYGLTPSTAALNGNDMTEKMYNNLYDYALRGLPLVLDEDMYMGDGDVANSDTVIAKNMQIDGMVRQIIENSDRNATTRNITYIKDGTNELLNSVIYIDKGFNNIVADKTNYSVTGTSYTLAENATEFNVTFSGTLPKGNYRVKVYMDVNQDGVFADQIGDEKELFCFDDSLVKESAANVNSKRDNNGRVKGKYVSISGTSENYSVSVNLPASAKGYFSWKTEIIQVDNANSNPAYYPKAVNTGAFAIKGTESTVRVLQILGSGGGSGSLDLKNDEAFNSKFNEVSGTTGLSLHVTQISQEDLNKKYNTYDSANNKQLETEVPEIVEDLENYSMIVLGFEGNYGTKSKLETNIVDAINQYIDDGYSVMFTFDTVSPDSSVSSENYAKGSVKDYNSLRTDTVKYIGKLNLKRQFTDPYLFKLARSNGGKNQKVNASPYTINTVDDLLLNKAFDATTGSYGYNGDYSKILSGRYIKISTTDIESNKASELNSGQVTSYPYQISESIPYLEGNSITVAETHAQYFALDLETDNSLYDDNGILKPQPIVWYTFAKSYDKNYCGQSWGYAKDKDNHYILDADGNKVLELVPGEADDHAARNLYYSATDKDAMNNYYIYSYGNVTYTAAGHDKITSQSELELFVNTFTKAILSGKHVPTVTYTDAKIDDTVTEYTSYVKTMYSKFVSSSLEFKFRIDFLSNFYRIQKAYMYIDLNSNGEYDADKDVGLGYIIKAGTTGNEITLTDAIDIPVIVPGIEYTVSDFWSLIDNDNIRPKLTAKGTDIDALKRALKDGTLNIGIKATSDQIVKGENVSGYSVLNFQLKDLFDLD